MGLQIEARDQDPESSPERNETEKGTGLGLVFGKGREGKGREGKGREGKGIQVALASALPPLSERYHRVCPQSVQRRHSGKNS